MKRPLNKKAFRRAGWGAIGRLIGVGLGAGAGSLIYQLTGGGLHGWGFAAALALVSFILMWYAEYEKDIDI